MVLHLSHSRFSKSNLLTYDYPSLNIGSDSLYCQKLCYHSSLIEVPPPSQIRHHNGLIKQIFTTGCRFALLGVFTIPLLELYALNLSFYALETYFHSQFYLCLSGGMSILDFNLIHLASVDGRSVFQGSCPDSFHLCQYSVLKFQS